MPPQMRTPSPGDTIHVAWIEPDETCDYTKFTVDDATKTDGGFLLVDVSNDDHDRRLIQTPAGPFLLLDQPEDEDDNCWPARAVLGVAPTAGSLLWEMQLTILELGHTPADAMDLIALRYGFVCSTGYAKVRGESYQDIEDRVDQIVAGLTSDSQTR